MVYSPCARLKYALRKGYLNEFVFRFNHRFWPMVAFDSVLKIAARMDASTYAGLYEGTWDHPGGWPGGSWAMLFSNRIGIDSGIEF